MKRREFIKKTSFSLAAAGLTAAAPSGGATAAKVKWRLASSFPKTLDTMYGGSAMLSKRVGELTDGQFEIKVLVGEQSVAIPNFIDLIQKNTVDCIHTACFYFHNTNKAFSIDTGIPFGLSARQLNAWYGDGQGLTLAREFFAKFNAVNFPGGNTGTQMGGWSRKEIKSLEDLKGFRIRIVGFGAEILSTLGVVPVAVPAGEIYAALNQGNLDAAEWVGPHDDERLALSKIAKFYYYPGWWEPGTQLSFLVNKDQWNKLPRPYQAAFEVATAEVNLQMMAAYDAKNPPALKRLVESGAEIRRFPDEVLKAAYEAAQKIYADESAKNPDFKKLYDSMVAFQQLSDHWMGLADGTLANFMQAQMRVKK
ncbi:MAG: ABC transporter substrate-binding protein [Candidatus Competibacter sp.]|nr:ABC transporter substrate-binding protein [Candidatus Competibacter sp.]